MEHITITRLSHEGFDPQNQDRYLDETTTKKDVTNQKFKNGVWVFVQWKEDKYLLNHLDLDEIGDIPFWQAEIPLDVEVFKHDNPYNRDSISTVEQEKDSGAFFIPDYSIEKLINVKEIDNPFSRDNN